MKAQRFYNLAKVQNLLGDISKATVYRMIGEGRLPAGTKVGKRRVAWPESIIAEVQMRMINQRIADARKEGGHIKWDMQIEKCSTLTLKSFLKNVLETL